MEELLQICSRLENKRVLPQIYNIAMKIVIANKPTMFLDKAASISEFFHTNEKCKSFYISQKRSYH